MAITKTQKHSIVSFLNDNVTTQKAVVLLTTKDTAATVDANQNFAFRKSCYDQGLSVQVVKNSLIQVAFPEVKDLVGQTYVIYMTDGAKSDEVTAPKAIADAVAKDFKDNFDIIGSVVNGEFYDKTATIALSKVSSFNDSMAMIAGSINQITAKIAMAIKEIPTGVARGVQAAKA
jgi:large subunit ribosomal protein L10